ncbi:MAG: EAL domain-containing protein [Pseudanabaena sp. ELA645]|jgi:diguanylate cyclase (GGDEF)-like protein
MNNLVTGLILIVDDVPTNLDVMSEALSDIGCEVAIATSGERALQLIERTLPDLILLDIMMTGIDGFETCRRLKANPRTASIPIIFMTALADNENKVKALALGAVDYVTKPFQTQEVVARVKTHLQLYHLTQNLELQVSQKTADLIEQQQQLQSTLERLHDLVFYDQLTGLNNRYGLLQEISKSMQTSRDQDKIFVLLKIDVERYAIIKTGFGHELSDLLLVKVARRLEKWDIPSKFVARLDNNEFAILLKQVSSISVITEYMQQMHQIFNIPIQLGAITVSSKTHLGAVSSEINNASAYNKPEDFLMAADTALDYARHDRNRTVFFNPSMQQKAIRRVNLEIALQKAIELRQIQVFYQPIFSLRTGKITSFEALARWLNSDQIWISPVEFIPLAEETGLIVPLGRYILSEACNQLGIWKKQFPDICPMSISVNLSSLQLIDPMLLTDIDRSLTVAGLDADSLNLEITESVLMENIETAIDVLAQLRQRHIGISIDDFGTGYSSLSYLQSLPITALKIDCSFIKDIDINSNSLEITSMIINLSNQLRLNVVAEGIQKNVHMDILKGLSCGYGQGFLFSQPVDAIAATALIATKV